MRQHAGMITHEATPDSAALFRTVRNRHTENAWRRVARPRALLSKPARIALGFVCLVLVKHATLH
jgi:hypothetical protein